MNRPSYFIVATLLASGLVALAATDGRSAGPQSTAPPGEVVVANGCRVRFVDEVAVSAERRGIVAAIARPGDRVDAGQDVARLRDSVLKASLAIAQREAANDVEVRFAQMASQLANLKYQWAVDANAKNAGTVSEQELKELQLAADRAALQCEQAEHGLAVARLKLAEMSLAVESLHISAPFAGQVLGVYKQVGEFVQEGEPLAAIVSADRVRVEGDVPLADAGGIAPGTPVQIRIEGVADPAEIAQRVFTGAVTFVDAKVEPVSQQVHIIAELENRHGLLRGGMVASMIIRRAAPRDGRVPSSVAPE